MSCSQQNPFQIPAFSQWRTSFLGFLAKKNIPVHEKPDGTIVAKYGSTYREMSPQEQQEVYQIHVELLLEELAC